MRITIHELVVGSEAVALPGGKLAEHRSVEPGDGIEFGVPDGAFRENHQVSGRRPVPGIDAPVVTGRIGEQGMPHADCAGARVHRRDKGIDAAAKMDGYGKRGVVARIDHRRLDQVAQPDLLARLKSGPGRLDLRRFERNRNHVIHAAALDGDHAGHDLGQAGRRKRPVDLFGSQEFRTTSFLDDKCRDGILALGSWRSSGRGRERRQGVKEKSDKREKRSRGGGKTVLRPAYFTACVPFARVKGILDMR